MNRQGRQLHQANQGGVRLVRADLAESQGRVAAGELHHRDRREGEQSQRPADDTGQGGRQPAERHLPQRLVRRQRYNTASFHWRCHRDQIPHYEVHKKKKLKDSNAAGMHLCGNRKLHMTIGSSSRASLMADCTRLKIHATFFNEKSILSFFTHCFGDPIFSKLISHILAPRRSHHTRIRSCASLTPRYQNVRLMPQKSVP
ncbi:unnamed protein product [Trichogramma brassicae]|uniref:Uncharacterized protein n=1 Tax=Trichogramma brassicae TaxID=86971 RepID=A0A6H5ISY2_9HYME|nr:unnamed protein product [Trichogramma brassicae]